MSANVAAAYATKADKSAANELGLVKAVATGLGTPLMPWQEQVTRVATEYKQTDRGLEYRYKTVIVTVPRQSGKTTLTRPVMLSRALTRRRWQGFYTAQTGKDARARWHDLVKAASDKGAPFERFVKMKLGVGQESLSVPETGSIINPFPPTETAVHGYTPNMCVLDEAWAWSTARGDAIMGAVQPAMQTRTDRQLWIISTAGDATSGFLKKWVDLGRQAVTDPLSDIAYFEWSAPDGLDLFDPECWYKFHPAVGHIVTAKALSEATVSLSKGQLERAYGNRWTTARESIIPAQAFEATTRALQFPAQGEEVLAFEVAPDSRHAAIWAAWIDKETGYPSLKAVKSDEGTDWLLPALAQIWAGARPKAILADDGGPTRVFIDRARLDGIEVETLKMRDFMSATADFIESMKTGRMHHDGSDNLRLNLAGAHVRPSGDSIVWSRRNSAGIIPDLIAATVAFRGAVYAPAPAPKPGLWITGAETVDK